MKIDRSVAPPVQDVTQLQPPTPVEVELDNGMKVYVLHFPGQDVLKIEAVFRAGRPQEQKKVVARATARLMREGTIHRSGAEIAEHFDFYGTSLTCPGNLDTSAFALFGLYKYAAEVIPVFAEILHSPSFPAHELETFKQTNISELSVELEKVEIIAYRTLTERLYGASHPYGFNSTPEDYNALTRDDLVAFHQAHLNPTQAMLFASGRVDEGVIQLLNLHFGQTALHPSVILKENTVVADLRLPSKPVVGELKQAKPGSLQKAIKIGRLLFNRTHPDFNGMAILTTLLGGYFGSRLMTNIREQKGYTYNIYASLDSMAHGGYLYMATEVNPEKSAATLRAIRLEVKKLREQPVDIEELDMVRNYLLGLLLTNLDGPMNIADLIRNLWVEGVGIEGFEKQVEEIRTITPARIQELAQLYLKIEDFLTVRVG